ncbi:MAG: ROK family transcriptional regulator [Acidobacteriaceae bacterium]|nr:ROK family transcriptional regulator [Acidobacteriaceae bacterium]MBV9224622.1 ROK family transcriptional regulator [Acidobacteriaceae bacterium]MBV9307167.1 ROK family transcriptional regulator [Acidobacteriaceae bacterium]MBV9676383.1 ROK family transcriptional regulator [Acidobacteriaceae bacterium]MBV9938717.1 ROK family transcriptional regulator [Acidobacteriaceae bacterium]
MSRKLASELQVLRVEDVRDTNETRFLHLIRDQQPISQTEVVRRTGLRPGTVSVVINRLLKAGFLYEAEQAPSKGGRRAVYLQVNAEKAYAVGLSIGVCESVYVVSDFNGRILSQRTLRTSRTAEPFLRQLGREIAEHVRSNYGKARFSAAGVSVPGLLDRVEGTVIFSPNLGWSNVPVRHLFEQELNLPVIVENDSNAAALSELWYGPLEMSSTQSLLFVLVIEGIGTGFILNGELHIGSSVGSAGFGHMSIDSGGPKCSCGSTGCLEALASDPATVSRFLRNHPEYSASVHSVHDIAGLAMSGNQEARQQLEKTATYLGIAIRGLAHGLSPEVIVVGGQITEAWPLVEPVLRRELQSGYLIEGLSLPQLRRATVERPPLFGAVPIALRSILKNRKKPAVT